MIDRQMQFLNHISLRLRSLDAHIAHILQFAVLCSRQSNDLHSLSVCGCRRIQHIFTVTTGGNAKEHIPGFTVTIDLLCKAKQRFTVIHISCGQGRVPIQRNSRKRPLQVFCQNRTEFLIFRNQFFCEVSFRLPMWSATGKGRV